MPSKSKSIYRRPDAQHFQLVHRSQRDPLFHDPDASEHVLKPFIRENDKKGKSRADLEQLLSSSDLAHDAERANLGEASLYGVYYDDTDYDYMQHLRTAGVQEDGVDSVLIQAPVRKAAAKSKGTQGLALRDLPAEALPSTTELPRDYESQEAVPTSIAGFQPDLDPHLRQVLEALEDDAFVDDGLEDDFFEELIHDGERDGDEAFEYEFIEDGIVQGEGKDKPPESEDGWEARFAAFQKQREADEDGSDDEHFVGDEDADTVGHLPEFSVVGGKKRRKGASDASGYSMSSSSMFRNEGLRTLDERFDKVEKEYMEDGDDDDDADADDSDAAPQLLTSREDFDSLMDDFLDNYEILGGKMKPSLHGTGPEKLQALRVAMGQDKRVKEKDSDESEDDDEDIYAALEREDKRDRWDVETVLTTHTNLENHPRLIRARQSRPVPQIHLDRRTGLPSVLKAEDANARPKSPVDEEASGLSIITHSRLVHPHLSLDIARVTVSRSREETLEEKKARKAAVKTEKQSRRVEKKASKQQYSAAIKQQTKVIASKETKMRKL
ncbi:Low temperature viability protein [Auriscalpium vulgare]|uniref:Low temperature viability protein n=1 Tax=Auriscalpium vulgare TaxID=40419 RepID=A0ACB8RZY3_9AGAM|nr:Low temperature viability protein [Auriscalpium vulgare]